MDANEHALLSMALRAVEKKVDSLLAENAQLRNDLTQKDAEIQRLREQTADLLSKITAKNVRINKLQETLQAAADHLEYCGYGDSWERACAKQDNLEERIRATLAHNSEGAKA